MSVEDIKILAAIRFNKRRAYAINRMPSLKYTRCGDLLIGRDGPFAATLKYEKPTKWGKAFAGRKFNIPMVDGSITEASGQWWHVGTKGAIPVTINTIESLKRCYVYIGSNCDPDHWQKLVDEYESTKGFYYDYYDYEKLITYDDLISDKFKQKRYFERAKGHLIDQVRGAHDLLNAYHSTEAA